MAEEQSSGEKLCSFCTRGPKDYHKLITSRVTQVSICDGCVIIAMEQWFREPKEASADELNSLRRALQEKDSYVARLNRESLSLLDIIKTYVEKT